MRGTVKKITISILFLLLMSHREAFASNPDSTSLLSSVPLTIFHQNGKVDKKDVITLTDDNKLSTWENLGGYKYIKYTFHREVNITDVFLRVSSYDVDYYVNFYSKNDEILYTYRHSSSKNNSYVKVSVNGVKYFKLSYNSSNGSMLFTLDLKGHFFLSPPVGLTATTNNKIVSLSWEDNQSYVQGYNVYKSNDGTNFTKVNSELVIGKSYLLDNLENGKQYFFSVTAVDIENNESGKSEIVSVVPVNYVVPDITNLQADAKYDRVKLSWTRPDSEFFSHVKIYRKKVEQQSFWDQLFGTTAVSAVTTSDGYTPMFETNGTYWTDLTVTPETTYSYKVTSVNIEGNESQGVTIETTTPSEPVPVLTGVATTQNEDGDYVVTWTSPTKGTVKLLIEGREYAQVDAATKQIIVRKEDMKTDFFGAYAATLIPIGEYGTKGQAVNVPSLGGKIDFPLSFQDFMETVVSILAWVAPFIILSLVFIFWRPIFNFIKKAISERRVKQ